MLRKKRSPLPDTIKPRLKQIVDLIDRLCNEHLSAAYAEVSKRLAETVAREHPALLERAEARSWAAAFVYAVGRINFLFDRSQRPHYRADALCRLFGVSPANVSPKAGLILDTVGAFPMHPDWTLPSRAESNPLTWMLEVNGVPVDVRDMPREVQAEAFRLGLIPYLPGERT